jgi:hypothetical protein
VSDCRAQLVVPTSDTTAQFATVPRSTIVISVSAALGRLRSELEARVPTLLDRANRRPIGVPGEVTYDVTRSAFDLNLQGDRLLASTLVRARVEICKPLGPFCPTYGRCSPSFVTNASVPLLLTPEIGFQRSRVSVQTIRSCSIAGFDVSPQISQIADAQARAAEQRIDAQLAQVRPQLDRAWKIVRGGLPVALGQCVQLRRTQLLQSSPTLNGGQLEARVGIAADLELAGACGTSGEGLPALSTVAQLDKVSRLHAAVRLTWQQLSTRLTEALRGQRVLPDAEIEAVNASASDRGRVRLRVRLRGAVCGEWLLDASPAYDANRHQLVVRELTTVAAQARQTPELAAPTLLATVSARARVQPPTDVSGALTRLRRAELHAPLAPGLVLHVVPGTAEVARVVATEEGLAILVAAQLELGLVLQ